MEHGWLQDFIALIETGSFSEAAKRRNSSQSAFSRRIQALESWLGARVVDRATQPVTVTPAGMAFFSRAKELLALADDARRHSKSKSNVL